MSILANCIIVYQLSYLVYMCKLRYFYKIRAVAMSVRENTIRTLVKGITINQRASP